jgi:hypothetical protein
VQALACLDRGDVEHVRAALRFLFGDDERALSAAKARRRREARVGNDRSRIRRRTRSRVHET